MMSTPPEPPPPQGGIIRSLASYVHYYGGLRAIPRSGYFWWALALALVSTRLWYDAAGWIETASAILPNLLGFTLGGLAILLAIGDDDFRRKLVRGASGRPGAEKNILLIANAKVVHFLVVQALCLVFATLAKGLPLDELQRLKELDGKIGWLATNTAYAANLVCTWLLFYALLLVVAAGLIIFQLAQFLSDQLKQEGPPKPDANKTTSQLQAAPAKHPDSQGASVVRLGEKKP